MLSESGCKRKTETEEPGEVNNHRKKTGSRLVDEKIIYE